MLCYCKVISTIAQLVSTKKKFFVDFFFEEEQNFTRALCCLPRMCLKHIENSLSLSLSLPSPISPPHVLMLPKKYFGGGEEGDRAGWKMGGPAAKIPPPPACSHPLTFPELPTACPWYTVAGLVMYLGQFGGSCWPFLPVILSCAHQFAQVAPTGMMATDCQINCYWPLIGFGC